MNNELSPEQKVEMMKQIFRILLRNGFSLQFPRYIITSEKEFEVLQNEDIFNLHELFCCNRYAINIEHKFITGV